MTMTFIDIGQGDAALLQWDGRAGLIAGGLPSRGTRLLRFQETRRASPAAARPDAGMASRKTAAYVNTIEAGLAVLLPGGDGGAGCRLPDGRLTENKAPGDCLALSLRSGRAARLRRDGAAISGGLPPETGED